MVRVPWPNSSVGLGPRYGDDEHAAHALNGLTGKEVDGLISRCAAALQSHGKDFRDGHDKENALAAFESAMTLLLEVRDIHPGKRADIDVVLVRFGYPIPEN